MFKYKGIKVNYKDFGQKDKSPIVYLHGWGQNIAMMEPIAKPFTETHRLVSLDVPGFGNSDEPEEAWDLEEYVNMLKALLDYLGIKKPNLIGHSFGGKISILYASKYDTERLILLSSPFNIKLKTPSLKVRVLKKAKSIPGLGKLAEKMKQHIGSTENAKQIKCPTFIIWGDKDEAVPVADAYELEKLIPDSGLTIYEGCTHYAYLERLGQTNSIIKSFIK